MDLVLRQLAGLLLGSVPTIVLFILVIFCYWLLVYRPLTRVLEERRKRTEGTMERANLTLAQAETKAREYEASVRAARLEIFHRREEKLRGWAAEREKTLASIAEAAGRKIEESRVSLAAEVREAEAGIESSAGELAERVLHAVLPGDLARDLVTSGSGR